MENILSLIQDFFHQRRCLHCDEPFTILSTSVKKSSYRKNKYAEPCVQDYFCSHCRPKVFIPTKSFCLYCGEIFANTSLRIDICLNCSAQAPLWDSFTFAGIYSSLIRQMILNAKFKSNTVSFEFLGKLLACRWWEKQKEISVFRHYDIIPIPLHYSKLRCRGYNQSLEIAKVFLKTLYTLQKEEVKIEPHSMRTKLKFSLNTKSLVRVKHTKSQSSLPQKERTQNIKQAFILEHIPRENIILIDDVATTLNTLKEACTPLKEHKPLRIEIATAARASLFH